MLNGQQILLPASKRQILKVLAELVPDNDQPVDVVLAKHLEQRIQSLLHAVPRFDSGLLAERLRQFPAGAVENNGVRSP